MLVARNQERLRPLTVEPPPPGQSKDALRVEGKQRGTSSYKKSGGGSRGPKEISAPRRTPSVPTPPVDSVGGEYSELQIKLEDYYQRPGESETYEISQTETKGLKRVPSGVSKKGGRVPQPPVSKKIEHSGWEVRAPPLTSENFFHPRRGSLKRPSLQKPLPPISPAARSKRAHPSSENNPRHSAW